MSVPEATAPPRQDRVGRCPGVLQPMASGDGLIVRIKPRAARLSTAVARAIAAAAAAHGNGALDLTARANLQIRGVTPQTLDALTARLDGLGLVDPSLGAEAVRNLLVSPLAGCDPAAAFDIGPQVAELERRLAADARLHALPAKFGFSIDDGTRPSLEDCGADIAFRAFVEAGRPAFAVRLGGSEDAAAVEAADLVPAALALAEIFIAARKAEPGLNRMRDAVAAVGAPVLFGRAGLVVRPLRLPPRAFSWSRLVGPQLCDAMGHMGATGHMGAAVPFGRLTSRQLAALAGLADRHGATGIRLTPWRAVLLPNVATSRLADLGADLGEAGFITDPRDARLRIAACVGAPDCRRASTPVPTDAAALAPRLAAVRERPDAILLHVSGCTKGCAHAGDSPITLVAQDGAYRIIENGAAGDATGGPAFAFGEAAARLERAGARTA